MNSTLTVAKLWADRSSLWFTAFFTHSLSLWYYPSIISTSPVFLSFIYTQDPLCLPHSNPLPLIKHTLGPRFIYGTLGGRCWVPRQMGPISSLGFLMWQQDPSECSWDLWIMLGNGAHAPLILWGGEQLTWACCSRDELFSLCRRLYSASWVNRVSWRWMCEASRARFSAVRSNSSC